MATSTFAGGVTPTAGGAPVAPGPNPQYIQFRFNGVDLGGPDVSVVDIVGDGISVVRGTGVDAGKITVSLG